MDEALTPEDAERLRDRLDQLERRERVITNKEALRELQYEAAELRWRLGLMTDEEFEQFEEFHDSFTFDF